MCYTHLSFSLSLSLSTVGFRETNSVFIRSVVSCQSITLAGEYSRASPVGGAWIVVWMQHGTHNHIGILLGSVFSLPASASSLPPNTLSARPPFQPPLYTYREREGERETAVCTTLCAHVNR